MQTPQKSRSGWLIVFGIVEALLAFFFCIVIAIVIMAVRPNSQTLPTKAVAAIAGMYGVLGLAFIAGSVGTLMRSNWDGSSWSFLARAGWEQACCRCFRFWRRPYLCRLILCSFEADS
jgi:hypothetical protein